METIIIAFVLYAGGFATGWEMKDNQQMKLEQVEQRAIDGAERGAAQAIAKIQVTNTTVMGQVIEHIRTEKVYTACEHTDGTWELVQEAYKPTKGEAK